MSQRGRRARSIDQSVLAVDSCSVPAPEDLEHVPEDARIIVLTGD
jgi:hypothetical protein